jgi:hypothetical protein
MASVLDLVSDKIRQRFAVDAAEDGIVSINNMNSTEMLTYLEENGMNSPKYQIISDRVNLLDQIYDYVMQGKENGTLNHFTENDTYLASLFQQLEQLYGPEEESMLMKDISIL